MKHTPGPYEIDGTCIYMLEFDSWRKGVEQMRNRIYANVQGYKETPKEEVEATARLMASAPELLEALKAAKIYVSNAYECTFPDEQRNGEVLKMIDAALAKATGE